MNCTMMLLLCHNLMLFIDMFSTPLSRHSLPPAVHISAHSLLLVVCYSFNSLPKGQFEKLWNSFINLFLPSLSHNFLLSKISTFFFTPVNPSKIWNILSKLYYYVKNNIIHSGALGVRIVWTQIEWLLSDCWELFAARWNQLLTPEF